MLRQLCHQRGIELEEGKAMADYIHMLLSVPSKFSRAMTIGYMNAQSAIRIHRQLLQTQGSLFAHSLWPMGIL